MVRLGWLKLMVFLVLILSLANTYKIYDLGNSITGGAVVDPAPGDVQAPTEPARVEVSSDDDAVKGSEDAAVTVIEFSDYECPFCARFVTDTFPQLEKEFIDTGKVKWVFRDFPLSFHRNAQKAAQAAECAGEEDKYWEMHDKLFANQGALDVASLKEYARELGLDGNEFDSCLDSNKFVGEVQGDMRDGSQAGVKGTPAFFINGKLLSGAQPFERFAAAIQQELER